MAARLWWTVNALQSVFESSELVRGPRHWNLSVCLARVVCWNSVLGQKIPFTVNAEEFHFHFQIRPQPPDDYQIMLSWTLTPVLPFQSETTWGKQRETEGEERSETGRSSVVVESHQHGAHWSNGISLVSNPWHHTSKALFIWVDFLSVVPGNPVSSCGCNSFSLFGGRRMGGCGEEPSARRCDGTAPLGPGMNLQCREGEKTHTLRMN